jgi:hypothetical protein
VSTNGRPSRTKRTGMSVVRRRVNSGSSQRMWLLPQVRSGTRAPQSASGRTRTRMRGLPASGLSRRMIETGR